MRDDHIWHHVPRWNGTKAVWSQVLVLQWDGGRATVININKDGLPIIEQAPYQVAIRSLRLGPAPEGEEIEA